MEKVLENIRSSPRFIRVYNILKTEMELEKEKRRYFYDIITTDKKMEFINGEIIMHSPVRYKHSVPSETLFYYLKTFVDCQKLGVVKHEKILITLSRNDYEPDITFFNNEKTTNFTPNQMKFPAPDFIVEILSETTEKIDRTVKFEDYAYHGVEEYWFIDPEKEFVEQYILKNNYYKIEFKSNNGIIESKAIPGFRLPVELIFAKEIDFEFIKNIIALK